jgi:hypothetical protein
MSEKSIRVMQERQIDVPALCANSENGWGLGWGLRDRQGFRTFGHGGGTTGQEALLQILPEFSSAFSVQANAIRLLGTSVVREVAAQVLYEITGVTPEESEPGRHTEDFRRFAGKFSAGAWSFDITEKGGKLHGWMEAEGFFARQAFSLTAVGENSFAMYPADGEETRTDQLAFLEPNEEGVPQYLFWGYRLHRRGRP